MTLRHCLLSLFGLMLACSDDPAVPADCTRAEPVQFVAGRYDHYEIQRAGDTTYLAMWGENTYATHAGSFCGADPVLIADGVRMLPTRIALDPLDDDPTLACDQDSRRHFRVDLTGERAPEMLLPYLNCGGRPTNYGSVFIGGGGYLHLFADFPDESKVTKIREMGGNDELVLDEWIAYTYASDLHAYEFSTGRIIDIPGKVLNLAGHGDHLIFADYEDTVTLVDLRSNTAKVLGNYDRDAVHAEIHYIPDFPYWQWGFDPSGQYIYHFLTGTPARAFDLAGRPVSLPVPGQVLEILDSGVLSVTREDGRVHFTRPGDAAATVLDVRLAEDEERWALQRFADHVEKVIDGDLVRVDFDGSPARVLVRDVGSWARWADEKVLLTLDEGTLERLDTETGERTHLAEHVMGGQMFGGGYYFLKRDSPDPADDGMWYLSPVALGVSGGAAAR